MKIGWDHTTAPELNQKDYYFFYVFNAKRVSYGSVTIGNYAVNKLTCDVWDWDNEKLVDDAALQRAQTALRQTHDIDEGTIERFRSRPFSIRAKTGSSQ